MVMYFERDGKFNWVDHNNVFVGFDAHQDCCEQFGWKYHDNYPIEEMTEMSDTVDLSNYEFDTSWFEEPHDSSSETGVAVFKMVPTVVDTVNPANNRPIYLELYNCHNGYYAHGFECKHNGIVLRSGLL